MNFRNAVTGTVPFLAALLAKALLRARRLAERARLVDDELQRLLDHLVAGVIVHDPRGVVVRVNPRATTLMRVPAAEMLGRGLDDPSWKLLRDDGSPMPIAEYPASVVLRGKAAPLQNLVVGVEQPQGAPPVWLLCNAYLEPFEAGGTLRRAVVMFADITQRVLADQQRSASERRFRLFYEHIHDGVLITAPGGVVLAANPAACRLFGRDEGQLIGLGREHLTDPGDPRRALLLLRGRPRDGDGVFTGQLRLRRADGSTFEADVSGSPFEHLNGESLVGIVIRDATLRHAADAASEALDQAEAGNRQKIEFLAKISHELRTPLNGMLGMAQLMLLERHQSGDTRDVDRLTHLLHSGSHLMRLVGDLLDLSAMESGAVSVHLREVDAAAIVREVVEQMTDTAQAAGIAIDVRADDGAHDVMADPGRLSQVMWNLLTNAVKYNRRGGSVQVSIGAHDERAEHCRIVVRDTGIGMTAEQLALLFQPFNRLGRERSDVPGTGIGLAVTRSLLERMGGSLRVASEPDRGSEFDVELRRSAPLAASAFGDLGRAAIAGAPRRVLYVDDDAVNRLVVRGMVEMLGGCEFVEASSAREGLRLARAQCPDAILTDLLMPRTDGRQLLDAIRADPRLRHVPCIAVSADGTAADIRAARQRGFDGYVVKPVLFEKLRDELLRAFEPARTASVADQRAP